MGETTWLLAFLFLCLGAGASYAQQDLTGVVGTATDESGAVAPGAKIAVTNADVGISRTTTTGAGGGFSVRSFQWEHIKLRQSQVDSRPSSSRMSSFMFRT